MKTKSLILAAGVLGFLLLEAPPVRGQSFLIRSDVTVAAGETQKNIFTIGGNAVVEGKVRQSVVAIGGTITVSGEVGDAVVGIGSRIIVKSSAIINGDVVALGGTLEKEPGCTIRGDTVYFQSAEIGDKIFGQGLFKGIFSLSLLPIILLIKIIGIFIWLVLAVIGAALFPKPIAFAAGEIRRSFWSVFGIGILSLIIFSGLVIFAAILSIILIGIPVLLALVAAGFIIKVFGRLAVFYFFGDSLLRAFGSKRISAMGAVLMGLLVISLISFLPFVGFLVLLILNIAGWGVAVRTKFGTTQNMFQKKQTATPAA
jgi:hypothetical protein